MGGITPGHMFLDRTSKQTEEARRSQSVSSVLLLSSCFQVPV